MHPLRLLRQGLHVGKILFVFNVFAILYFLLITPLLRCSCFLLVVVTILLVIRGMGV